MSRPKPKPEHVRAMRELYEVHHLTCREIGEICGYTYQGIHSILCQYAPGFQPRSRGHLRTPAQKLHAKKIKEAHMAARVK